MQDNTAGLGPNTTAAVTCDCCRRTYKAEAWPDPLASGFCPECHNCVPPDQYDVEFLDYVRRRSHDDAPEAVPLGEDWEL